MGQQLSFIWPALCQRPSGLARQRRAGRSVADGACCAPASPELLAWPGGRIKRGAGLILTAFRFASGSADVPPAESPRRPSGPAANGYRLHVVVGTGQVDHALASWLTGPGQAVPAGVAASATSAGARPTRRTPAVPVTPTRAPTFSASPTCRTPTALFRISPLAWPRWDRTSAPALPRVPLRGRCAGETVGSWAERALVPAGSSA